MIKVTTLSFIPIYEQIKMQIKNKISIGDLKPNEPLPSIRDLATQLVINPNTVARAYRELEIEGFIYSRKGKGCYVTNDSLPLIHEERKKILNKIFDDAIKEAEKFNLKGDEIMRLFEQRFDLLKSEKAEEE
jgi:GntR family transcriptional regulator